MVGISNSLAIGALAMALRLRNLLASATDAMAIPFAYQKTAADLKPDVSDVP